MKNYIFLLFFGSCLSLIACTKWDLDKVNIQSNIINNPPTTSPNIPIANNYDLNKIYFSSNLVGYIVGNNVILKTVNGGSTWAKIKESNTVNYTALYFINDNNGYLGGNDQYYNYLYATYDGGATWNQIDKNWYSNDQCKITDIIIADNTIFYLSNAYPNATQVYGYLRYSTDNGVNWKTLTPNNNGKQGLNCAAYNNGTILIGGSTYWDFSQYYSGTQNLLNISNPNLVASKIDLVASINGISIFNNKAIAVGDGGSLSISSNKGTNWTSRILPNFSNINFRAVKIIDDLNYYLAGDSGTLLKSSDAGVTWQSISTSGVNSLNSFSHKPNGELYLVGNGGQIIKVK